MEIKTPTNPSKKATARVKNPLPVPTNCHLCSGSVRIGTHGEVYGRDFSDWPYVYLCESCGAYVGLHPFTAIPLGTLADKPTRDARKSCKMPFERIWKSGAMTRTEAYQWLSGKMGIPVHECHFGWFTVEQCLTAMHHCNDWLNH
ncbi:zinc-finger-containing protein, partial [Enterobacter hormaechei]|nr:zinc-finger-containing protein [Enterobacter hormaechei]MDU5667721.1 zinc-finger-containing protein [Enterobacter hormaechei]MDU5789210.1 zinc-finger-containing protein [Enterobacter hormaechei]